MAATMGESGGTSDHGHTGAVDDALARAHGGRPATWHARRFGPHAVNHLTAAIIEEWRKTGDLVGLAGWLAPIEAAVGASIPAGGLSARLRAALADAAEDSAEAQFVERPCTETARELLRKRAADRLASLEHDREIAERYGLTL
jgi:hypothetical protein